MELATVETTEERIALAGHSNNRSVRTNCQVTYSLVRHKVKSFSDVHCYVQPRLRRYNIVYARRVYIPANVLSGVECRPQWIPVVESIDPVHESGKQRRRWR